MLVFALNLEQVEEIGAGGVDFNQVIIRGRTGSGKICDGEVKGCLYCTFRCLAGILSTTSSSIEHAWKKGLKTVILPYLDILPNLNSSHFGDEFLESWKVE